jgi:hypothetical protein
LFLIGAGVAGFMLARAVRAVGSASESGPKSSPSNPQGLSSVPQVPRSGVGATPPAQAPVAAHTEPVASTPAGALP